MNHSRKLAIFLLLVLLGGCAPQQLDSEQEQVLEVLEEKREPAVGMIEEGTLRGEPYALVEGAMDWNPADDHELCYNSSHVFYGEVTDPRGQDLVPAEPDPETGEVVGEPFPYMLFEVEVQDLLKGELEHVERTGPDGEELVVVKQAGGQVRNDMAAELLVDDKPLIPGDGYVFFVNFDEDKKHYQITAQPHGNAPYTNEERLEELGNVICPNATQVAEAKIAEREALQPTPEEVAAEDDYTQKIISGEIPPPGEVPEEESHEDSHEHPDDS